MWSEIKAKSAFEFKKKKNQQCVDPSTRVPFTGLECLCTALSQQVEAAV